MKRILNSAILQELLKTFKAVKKNWAIFIAAAILDIVFVFSKAFFATPVTDRMSETIVLMANKLSPMLAAQETGILLKLFTGTFKPLTGKLILLVLLFFAILYIVYIIFQGVNWWIITRIAGNKEKFRKYFLGFALINITWFGFYVLYKLVDLFVGLRRILIEKFSPDSVNIAGGLVTAAFIFLAITALFSYPGLKRRQIFMTPLKITIPLIVISAAILMISSYILNLVAQYTVYEVSLLGVKINLVAILLALLLFLPVNYVKIYITRVLSNVRS